MELEVQLFCPLEVIPIAAVVIGMFAAVKDIVKEARRRGVMSLSDKFHGPIPASIRDFGVDLGRWWFRVLPILALAAAVTVFLTLIVMTGHPIIAMWLALAIVSWLFIAGAAKASGDCRSQNSDARRTPPWRVDPRAGRDSGAQ